MKQTILFTVLGVVALGASAQEVGRVVSSVPVVQQVAVPRQVCGQTFVQAQPQTTGGGALLGGLTGAGIGSTIGGGAGTAAAMVVGTVAGALIGNNIEASNQRAMQAVPTCTTETTYENRTVGYNVTYEYAGRQFTTQMAYDPGATVALQISPTGGSSQYGGPVVAPPMQAAQVQAVPAQGQVIVQQQPAQVVYQQAYPAYPVAVYPAYPYPAYPVYRPYFPVGISLGFGFGGGHHHWR